LGRATDDNPLDTLELEAALDSIQPTYNSEKGGKAIETYKAQ